ncbi:hypothetical protein [Streptomyces sp. NPDC059916]|uniref:hypothetical protein n=1 Tax=Streptomyces sp. NPDC059916 TaxID=3347001 RepID=UPI00368286AE
MSMNDELNRLGYQMQDRLPPQREAEIAARAEAATPGPWERAEDHGKYFYAYLGGAYMRGVGTLNFGEGEDAEADRAFVLNAREDVDLLLAELAAARAERDEVKAQLAERLPTADVVAWLAKKAGEYQSGGNRENAATAIGRLADKVSRGAIRPGELTGGAR